MEVARLSAAVELEEEVDVYVRPCGLNISHYFLRKEKQIFNREVDARQLGLHKNLS